MTAKKNPEITEEEIINIEDPAESSLDDFQPEDLADFSDIDDHFGDDDLELDSTQPEAINASENGDLSHFDENTLEDSSAPKATKSGGIISFIKENWLYSSIGIIVVAVAGYIIMGQLFPSTTTPKPTQQSSGAAFSTPTPEQTAQINATSNGTNAPAPTQGTPALPAPQPTVTMTQAQMSELMNSFSSDVQKSMNSIQEEIQSSGSEATNKKLSNLEVQLSSLNHTVKKLNNTIASTSSRLKTTQAQLGTVLGQESANQAQLTLRATVPGRAWLVNASGETISVTVGSSLGNIGLVTAIDSKNSTVTTSSGYIFK